MATQTSIAIEGLKFLSPEEVRTVAARFGTPAFVYDEASLERNAEYMTSLPNAFGLTIRYSLKACPTAAIVRLFDRLGLSFDASSVWEARRAMRAGVAPSKILLTAQEARAEAFEAVAEGVLFDAGSIAQLDAYGRRFPGSDISVRINPGFGSGLVNRLTSGGPNSSFGIWHEEVERVAETLAAHDLRLVRVHSHIGSSHESSVLLRALVKLLDLATRFTDVGTVNLGGGYKVKALLDDPEYDFREWAASVAQEVERFAEDTGREVHVELEPGTFLMANSGSIVTRVVDVVSTGDDGHRFVKIDAGLTEILRPSYYGARHPLVSVPAEGPLRDEVVVYCVSGHCCIAGDVLTTSSDVEYLEPQPLARTEIGDYLVIERGGGYCSSMCMKNFNSYPEAPEILRRKDGSFAVIRERQALDQIVANERMPDDLLPA